MTKSPGEGNRSFIATGQPIAREHKCAGRKNEKMGDGKGGGLLRKSEREFPDENDGSVYKNGKRSVLKFAGEIAADPGIRAQ